MSSHVLELAIFKIKPEFKGDISRLRIGLRQALKDFPGLIEFQAYEPLGDGCYADVAKWENYECALAAANAFEAGDQRFLPYLQAIETLTFMGHFSAQKA
ncbi:MAG: hypothetical protein P4L95_20810 [Rouxiella aceris]|uniref:ABM domain-containing protein n=1 Tax=Rouxiella aceris TaxID=2703884 RepID=A0A848MHJ7_9GAMM|nr:hypothetical protein [Rouxiella aceris]MDR3434307.1 hypothetical protein [Rouxiella aceris]NMP26570.1 hypothetical protein [Rouxiella aceris]